MRTDNINDVAETLIIPPACHERFLPNYKEEYLPLKSRDIFGGGLSELIPPYEVRRLYPPFHVVMFVERGELKLSGNQGDRAVKAGQVLVAPVHKDQWYRAVTEVRCFWVHLLDTERWCSLKGTGPMVYETACITTLLPIVEGFLAESLLVMSGNKSSSIIAMSYGELLGLMLERELLGLQAEESFSQRQQLGQLWSKIIAELAFPWTIEDMADIMLTSPANLHRIVKRHTDRTPMSIIASFRMDHAEQLLVSSHLSVSDVAERVGYSNTQAFSRAFKNHTGTSPSEYRKSHP